MNTEDVVLIVLDEAENFNLQTTQLRIGKNLWRDVIQVSNRNDFDSAYQKLEPDQDFILACHLFHAKEDTGMPLRGYYQLLQSKIEKDYKITAQLVSSGDSGEVMKNLYSTERASHAVLLYSNLRDSVTLGKIPTYKKKNMTENLFNGTTSQTDTVIEADFGIITALYKDEFNQIEEIFEWTGKYETDTNVYKLGYPKSNPEKKIVAVHLTATGIIDAAVIATEMAEIFKPSLIMMPGVCGGDIGTNIGDVVVARKVFMFQKGKISDLKDTNGKLIRLYDSTGKKIDVSKLQDSKGNRIALSVEKFEIEHSSICDTDPKLIAKVEPQIENIEDKINKEIKSLTFGKTIKIHFEPMACSTMVINKGGFFEKNVKAVDRKVIALEMESYGIARACQLANGGRTRFLIFKSVMDNMKDKSDHSKAFAGKTSALFLKFLLEANIL